MVRRPRLAIYSPIATRLVKQGEHSGLVGMGGPADVLQPERFQGRRGCFADATGDQRSATILKVVNDYAMDEHFRRIRREQQDRVNDFRPQCLSRLR